MKPGVYTDISNSDYHGGPGISKSGLDLIHRSPLHYQFATSAANDNEPTPDQALGTAFHALLLEPAVFAQTYCLGLRRQDVPEAIDERDVLEKMVSDLNASREAAFADAIRDKEQLVVMIQALNATRKPKLPTGGTKAELVDRILNEQPVETYTAEQLEGMKAPELKAIVEQLNGDRTGLLSTNGSVSDLAATLRANGVELTLWSEICDQAKQETGVPFIGSTSASRHEMAAWLRANGQQVTLWSDVQAEWIANNAGRIVLEDATWQTLMAMRDSVMAHPVANALLTGKPGVAEHSIYWIDEQTGELCRCRPDWWREDDIFVDVKTTNDASPEGFAKSIVNWRYDVQDPFYRDGFRAATGRDLRAFIFLAVEKKAPYAVGVYVMDAESIALGRAQYRADLQRYAECKAADQWPGYGDKIQTISLPAWHANKNAHLLDAAE